MGDANANGLTKLSYLLYRANCRPFTNMAVCYTKTTPTMKLTLSTRTDILENVKVKGRRGGGESVCSHVSDGTGTITVDIKLTTHGN